MDIFKKSQVEQNAVGIAQGDGGVVAGLAGQQQAIVLNGGGHLMVLRTAVQTFVAVDILRRVQHTVAVLVFDNENTGAVLTAVHLNGFDDAVAVDVFSLVEYSIAVDIFAAVDLVLDVRQGVGGDDVNFHAVDAESSG